MRPAGRNRISVFKQAAAVAGVLLFAWLFFMPGNATAKPGGGKPAITGMHPAIAHADGGQKVTVAGRNFKGVKFARIGHIRVKAMKVRHGRKLTFILPSANPGRWHVVVRNRHGRSRTSRKSQLKLARAPGRPQKVTVTIDQRTANLSWQPPLRTGGMPVTRYEILSRLAGETKWNLIDAASATAASIPNLPTGVDTEIALRAVNGIGAGLPSRTVTARPAGITPPPPPPPPPPRPIPDELPLLDLTTVGNAPILDRENYVDGAASIDPRLSGLDAYEGELEIRGRGNSTWAMPKKPYRLKLGTKSELLGMPSNRDWALLANYIDASHLRNTIGFSLGENTALGWTPRLRHVNLRLNGDYLGLYTLTEHVKVASSRVDIHEMDDDDIAGNALTGGYLLERDARMEEFNEPGFRTSENEPIVIKDPDPAEPEQFAYIQDYIQDFEDALFSPDFEDPVDGYRPYIDLESFADYYLVTELTHNQDVGQSSVFMNKPRGEPLRMGPLWDFDYSMGHPEADPETWWVREENHWYSRMAQDPAFLAEVSERWDLLKLDLPALYERIDEVHEEIEPSLLSDWEEWSQTPLPRHTPEGLKSWLQEKAAWLDTQI